MSITVVHMQDPDLRIMTLCDRVIEMLKTAGQGYSSQISYVNCPDCIQVIASEAREAGITDTPADVTVGGDNPADWDSDDDEYDDDDPEQVCVINLVAADGTEEFGGVYSDYEKAQQVCDRINQGYKDIYAYYVVVDVDVWPDQLRLV